MINILFQTLWNSKDVKLQKENLDFSYFHANNNYIRDYKKMEINTKEIIWYCHLKFLFLSNCITNAKKITRKTR